MSEELPLNDPPMQRPQASAPQTPASPLGNKPNSILDTILQTPTESLIPWETCTLPSLGLYYNWPTKEVRVRAMTQKSERILANRRLNQTGQSLSSLFKDCCEFPDPNFNPDDLLVGDRTFLLYYIRGITYGNIYEFSTTCPNPDCGNKFLKKVDINTLVNTVTQANPNLGPEPFRLTMPYLSKQIGEEVWIQLRFIRASDQLAIMNLHKMKKSITQGAAELDDMQTEIMSRAIVSCNGEYDPHKISMLVKRLHASDISIIREFLKKHSPSMDSTYPIQCDSCQLEYQIELPMTDSFFRKSD